MTPIRNSVSSLLMLCALLCGCVSNTKQIGQIGNTRFYQVKARSFCGPNLTALVTQDETHPETAHIETVAGGSGIGHTIISAAGNAGAAAAFGLSLRPDQTSVDSSAGSASDASSTAAASGSGGSSASGGGGHTNNVNNTHGNNGNHGDKGHGNSANAPGHNK